MRKWTVHPQIAPISRISGTGCDRWPLRCEHGLSGFWDGSGRALNGSAAHALPRSFCSLRCQGSQSGGRRVVRSVDRPDAFA